MYRAVAEHQVCTAIGNKMFLASLVLVHNTKTNTSVLGLKEASEVMQSIDGRWSPMALVSDPEFARIYAALCLAYRTEHAEDLVRYNYVGTQ